MDPLLRLQAGITAGRKDQQKNYGNNEAPKHLPIITTRTRVRFAEAATTKCQMVLGSEPGKESHPSAT
jgi:hypothetical protein